MTPLPVRLVFLRPRNPENLGAVARAMKNFGAGDWAIVDPRTLDFHSARRVAVHAEELLDRPRVVTSLDEAVADCAWVVGTSTRRLPGKRQLAPEVVAREAFARAASGPTALVFGDERSGLTHDELGRCHDLSAIPTEASQPSMNLAQAAVVYCYELSRAGRLEAPAPGTPRSLALDSELAALQEALRATLVAGGFLVDEERSALAELAGTLQRAALSRREARLWTTALRSLQKRLSSSR
jgi:tRNA/rRNA methyltransferase